MKGSKSQQIAPNAAGVWRSRNPESWTDVMQRSLFVKEPKGMGMPLAITQGS
jgi:hypothetical protein